MKRWMAALLLLAVVHPLRAAPEPLDQVMQLLAARRHGEVSFVEQHFLKVLKRPAESSGELIYDAPNRLEQRTLEPRAESMVVVGDELTLRRSSNTRVLDLQSYPQIAPFVDSVRATLAGDRGALERMFRLDFLGSLSRWTLTLTPTNPQVAKTILQVQIDGSQDQLWRVEIKEADGDRSLMTLRPHPAP